MYPPGEAACKSAFYWTSIVVSKAVVAGIRQLACVHA
jgi:hypothetical protein